MMMETPSDAPKLPVKRSLFKKPAWTRPQIISSPENFFHRANAAQVDPLTEIEQKRKAKATKKAAERAQQQAEKARQEAETQTAQKRRRISQDDDDDLYGVSDQELRIKSSNEPRAAVQSANSNDRYMKGILSQGTSSKSLAKRYHDKVIETKVQAELKPSSTNIIDLDDSDEEEADDGMPKVALTKKPPPPPVDDDFPASDEEYAELARKARDKARRKRLEAEIPTTSQNQSCSAEPEDQSRRSLSKHMPTPPPSGSDPEVHILITSRLENVVPLVVKRRLSQRLKDVRLAWCAHNHFVPEMTDSIFLTWRGKRLFDVTSCRSLGIAIDKYGRVQAREDDDILAEESRNIHMEAMTEEIYEEVQKAKRRAMNPGPADDEEEQQPEPQKPQEAQVRVILKAKGVPDFKVAAKPVSLLLHIV